MRWLVVLVAACGTTQAPVQKDRMVAADAAVEPPALDQDLPKLAARSLELFQDLARTLDAVGEDCAAATAKLDELGTRYADVVTANAKVQHDNRDLQLKIALRQYETELDAAAQQIMASKTLPACAEDPAFQRAFDGLRGG